jgi:type II secretory pathway pseudopilin PulG
MAAEPRVRRGGQCGETLLETLVAILVLSLVVGAAYTGLRVALRVSAQHKESAVAETLLRSAAERLQDPTSPYVPLAGCGDATYTGLPTRSGYGPIQLDVRFWDQPTDVDVDQLDVRFDDECPDEDPGLQSIELSVETPSGHLERLEILKRAS